MTVTGDSPPRSSEPAADATVDLLPSHTRVVYQVCPYLQGEGGGWRSLQPTRDHRCAATQPAAEPALAKQRELCLRPAHATCATYLAARALEQGEEPDPRVDSGLWPSTKQAVLALKAERAGVGPFSPRAGRTVGQGLLAALIVVAFLVLVVARTTPTGTAEPSLVAAAPATQPAVVAASGDPGSAPTALAPSPTPSPDPSPSQSAAPATPAPSPTAGAGSPTPAAPQARYKVKGGDTLSSIAIAHGVTVKQLRRANGIEGNTIRPGQVLVIP